MPETITSTHKDSVKPNSQWAILAATRFVLSLCVVIMHSGIVAPGYFIQRHFGATGYPAVFGFFMISGYSIASSLKAQPEGYFWRRVRRIYPTYLCALAFSVAILLPHPLHLPFGQVLPVDSWKTIVGNVFMMQGILVPSVLGDGVVWTLSIEWWCYMLAIPLIKRDVKWSIALTAVSFAALMVYMHKRGYIGGAADMPLHAVSLIALAWGWLTGFTFYRRPTKWNFAIMTLLPLLMFEIGERFPLASVVIVASALAIYFAKEIHIKSETAERIMKWLGNMSYPLYLFHPPLLYILASKGIITNGDSLIVAIVIIVGLGYYVACRFIDAIGRATSIVMRRSNA
ncbi:peptidoglycan/LPS O-acetylase OafA/YrhL [Paraburkholderia caballeronis]|uniref:acyltransferase family protein n=1 Tax=Paraburkholderia caballeronis TaxID=416943 RepID=UPI00106683D1|nr:acyltransferase [Paraburkholderia caballeronis]TDV39514.1 peptidoglycan/LPS O-acetylase OafA/YrhL [Paraburkholderia caballeronis]